MSINWSLIPVVINEYAKLGYKYVEVPWLVDKESIFVTLPNGRTPFKVDGIENKYLIGSAEQSFIHLALKDKITTGKYIAATPCFRDDEEDFLHQKTFFKVELIDLGLNYNVCAKNYNQMMNDARGVLSQFTKKSIVVQPTDDGCDLTLNGIEIGSYGKRNYKNINWVYGTGIAEPRFSTVNGM